MVSFTACNKHPIENKQVNVVFRLDDYSACSNTDMELRIIDAFRKNDACITLGVIPYVCAEDIHDPSAQDVIPLTSMKGDILKNGVNEGILDVALHGVITSYSIHYTKLYECRGQGCKNEPEHDREH